VTVTVSPATITRLEKAAVDNGFDLTLPRQGDWLGFASTQAPLKLWLTAVGDALFLGGVSQPSVARALADHGSAWANPLPEGAAGARSVVDIPALHHLVRRAFHLSKTLPDELLHEFEKQTAALPRATEAEGLVVQRVGQELFRGGLVDYWEGRCAITGLAVTDLLRASHIKPWAACATDAERLDVFNGLLLAPHHDAAFDRGYITVKDDGVVVISNVLTDVDRAVLGLTEPMRVTHLADGHRAYLPWHRDKVFESHPIVQKSAPDVYPRLGNDDRK
jgi:putative restriction endonuclease